MDRWPAIKVKRLDGEGKADYEQRRAEIAAIISGFRKGRFDGPLADKLDVRLEALLSGDGTTVADPYQIIGWEQRPLCAPPRVIQAA